MDDIRPSIELLHWLVGNKKVRHIDADYTVVDTDDIVVVDDGPVEINLPRPINGREFIVLNYSEEQVEIVQYGTTQVNNQDSVSIYGKYAWALLKVINGSWFAFVIDTNRSWHTSQAGAYTELFSSSSTIAIDLADGNNFKHTTIEDTTLGLPINPVPGQAGVLEFNQGATPYTLAFNQFWKFPGGVDASCPALTAAAGATDVFSYIVHSSGNWATVVLLANITNCVGQQGTFCAILTETPGDGLPINTEDLLDLEPEICTLPT